MDEKMSSFVKDYSTFEIEYPCLVDYTKEIQTCYLPEGSYRLIEGRLFRTLKNSDAVYYANAAIARGEKQ